jgi:hypothetical protein
MTFARATATIALVLADRRRPAIALATVQRQRAARFSLGERSDPDRSARLGSALPQLLARWSTILGSDGFCERSGRRG